MTKTILTLSLGLTLFSAPTLAEECEYVCEYVCGGVAAPAEETNNYDLSKTVLINELYPEPLDGEDEFIELKNTGSATVNLTGWYLTDASGKKFTLSGELKDYLVLTQTETKIYLNNTGDEVSLFQPDNTLLDNVQYDSEGDAGWSYVRQADEWAWSLTASAGMENIISEPAEEDGTTDNSDTNTDGTDNTNTNTDNADEDGDDTDNSNTDQVMSIDQVRALEKGAAVVIQGVVTVEPGILGTQIFYIEDGTAGIQIYSSQKLFPELNTGNEIQVQGELSEAFGEKKINIKAETDITILGDGEINIGEVQGLGEELEGQLVSTAAQIQTKETNKLHLTNGVTVYIKSTVDLSLKDYTEGDALNVTGIVSEYNGEYRLLPRSAEDIVVTQKYNPNPNSNQSNLSLIQPAQAASGPNSVLSLLPGDNGQKTLYSLIGLAGLLLIGAIIGLARSEWGKKVWRRVRITDKEDQVR